MTKTFIARAFVLSFVALALFATLGVTGDVAQAGAEPV